MKRKGDSNFFATNYFTAQLVWLINLRSNCNIAITAIIISFAILHWILIGDYEVSNVKTTKFTSVNEIIR